MSGQQANTAHGEKPRAKNKAGLYIVLAFVVITITAMFTNGFGLFANGKEKEKTAKNDFGYFENTSTNPEKNENKSLSKGNEAKIIVTGEQPSENNISVPPGCTYKITTSVPVNILFEDGNGNQVEDNLRPGEEKDFPPMTPIKVWRQKAGKSVVKIIYSEN